MFKVFSLLLLFKLFHLISSVIQPEQIHLSYGGHPTQMWVTWVTMKKLSERPSVRTYRDSDQQLNRKTYGKTYPFHMKSGRTIYNHRVLLQRAPDAKYMYIVGSKDGWSKKYYFKTFPLKPRPSGYSFAVFGDLGVVNGRSLPFLKRESKKGAFDMVLHIGDIAYDLDINNGKRGDEYMRLIEPIAASIPYMTVAGNHEHVDNFTHYTNRFNMPGPYIRRSVNEVSKNIFYSFDLGLTHFVGISTEVYFFSGAIEIQNQYKWLQNDLKKANKNRHKVPWIITMGHRPMYCSNVDSDDCGRYENTILTKSLEGLFYNEGVDLALWAHAHSYERLWPIYKRTVYVDVVTRHIYNDPPTPIHVTSGAAASLTFFIIL